MKKATSNQGSTKLAFCTCANAYQDAKYGKGVRVHNVGKNNSKVCTVCGSKKS